MKCLSVPNIAIVQATWRILNKNVNVKRHGKKQISGFNLPPNAVTQKYHKDVNPLWMRFF